VRPEAEVRRRGHDQVHRRVRQREAAGVALQHDRGHGVLLVMASLALLAASRLASPRSGWPVSGCTWADGGGVGCGGGGGGGARGVVPEVRQLGCWPACPPACGGLGGFFLLSMGGGLSVDSSRDIPLRCAFTAARSRRFRSRSAERRRAIASS